MLIMVHMYWFLTHAVSVETYSLFLVLMTPESHIYSFIIYKFSTLFYAFQYMAGQLMLL